MPLSQYEIVTGIIVVVLVFLLFISCVIVMVLYLNFRKKEAIKTAALQRRDFEEELLRTRIEIQDQTSKIISLEIHDNVAQILTLAKLNLATTDIEDQKSALTKIESSRDLVGKAIQDLRDLSKTLNPDYILKSGLVSALAQQREILERIAHPRCTMDIRGTPAAFDPKKELIVFRIIQEAIGNCIKHAGASSLNLEMEYCPGELRVKVTDDGQGFEPSAVQLKKPGMGMGISSMQHRAKLIGASLKLESSAAGTEVFLSIPYNTETYA